MNNSDFGFLIQMLSRQIFRYFTNAGKQLGISSMEVNILNYLFDNQKDKIYQKDLEDAFSIRSSTATANINLMEKKDLLRREPDSNDLRRKILVVTPKAKELEQKLNTSKKDLESRICQNLSQEQQEQFRRMLEQVSKNLS